LVDKYPGAKVWSYAYGTELGSVSFIKQSVPRLHARQPRGGGDKMVRSAGVSAAWNGTPNDGPGGGFLKNKGPRVLVPQQSDPEYDADDIARTPDVRSPRAPRRDPYPWVNDFISELQAFTGLNDPHDDQVDALAAAYDALQRGTGPATASAMGGSRPDNDRPSL
jgi:hypothetical protein